MKIMVRCKGYKRSEKYFTIGKVYEWEDGHLTNDNNFTYDNFMCGGTDPNKWRLSEWCDFEVVQDQKMVITTDGKETLARLYEGNNVIKTATARCAPDDTFDFATGAKLAFNRLMGEPLKVAKNADKPMTCREKLAKEKPECVGSYGGGCKGCPHNYGYAKKQCNHDCRKCWDRPVEQPVNEQKEAKETPENAKWRVVNREPKVGDYIRLKTKTFSFDEIGDILKVDIVKYDDFVSVYGRNHKRDTRNDGLDWNYSIGVDCEIVEPVNPEKPAEKEEPRFKVGDRVKSIGDEYKGKIGIVIEDDGNEPRYKVEFDDGDWTFKFTRNLEKVETKTEEREFKVGDKVKIVKGLKFVGEIGTVIEDDGTGAVPFNVKLDNGESCWKFGSNLEKVEEQKEPELKVGDHVKVVNRGKNFSTYERWVEKNAPDYLNKYQGKSTENGVVGVIRVIAPHGEITSYGDICLIECSDNRVFLIGLDGIEKVEFAPHLLDGKRHLGNIGEPTNYKDAIGRPLCVGDVVEHFNGDCESYGDTVIVKSKLSYRNNEEKTFVMGIESECNDKNGTTGEWKILKKRSFEEVANGEKVFGIKYVKEI